MHFRPRVQSRPPRFRVAAEVLLQYDRIIAGAVFAALIALSVHLTLRTESLKSALSSLGGSRPASTPVQSYDPAGLAHALGSLSFPAAWEISPDQRGMFVPPQVELDGDGGIQRTRPEDLDGNTVEGLPKAWLHRHGLSRRSPVANTDPDREGWTVREEYEAGTNPVDAKSHPDAATKLRVTQLNEGTFPFRFTAVQISGDERVFSLQSRDGSKEYFVRIGGTVPDRGCPGWKVVRFEEKTGKRPVRGMTSLETYDASELTLRHEGEADAVFVKGTVTHNGRFTARTVFLLDRKTFDLAPGSNFTLDDHVYRVVKIGKKQDGLPDVEVARVGADTSLALRPPSREEQAIISNKSR